MKQPFLRRLRSICLVLPEAEERETWGEATFRVRDKIFCMHIKEEVPPALWCKAPAGSQTILVGADPERFFIPPYAGHKGWVGMRLDATVDWREVAEVVKRSYRMTAPKKVVATMDKGLLDEKCRPMGQPGGRISLRRARRVPHNST